MKLNPDKYHVLLNTKKQSTLNIDVLHISYCLCEKLFGINFNYQLNFAEPIEAICQKA